MSLNSNDGKNFRRVTGQSGDRNPIAMGIQRPRAIYTAIGGELSLDLTSLSTPISYNPGKGQLDIKSSLGSFIAGVDFYETSSTLITFPVALQPNEKLEITQTFLFTGNVVAQVVPNVYTINNAATGLTTVTANFSWPLNGLPSQRIGYVTVKVNGREMQRNSNNSTSSNDGDYYEVNLGTGNTNQIVFTSALLGGENISLMSTFQAIDTSAASTLFNNTSISNINTHMYKNYLINSNFDFWQRGTTGTIANTVSSYVSTDRWYGKNSLGTNGVLTLSQTSGVTPGSKYGCSLQITTSPTAAQTNGCELYQVVENIDSLDFLGKNASFGCYVKALGNVNQIGLSLVYATTETKPTATLGSETLITVNSSTFTLSQLLNISVGSSQTNAGVIGVKIRITGVSTGNTYDLNNGFVIEQTILNQGSVVAPYLKAGKNAMEELAMCQRYYYRVTAGSALVGLTSGTVRGATQVDAPIRHPVTMRTVPTFGSNSSNSIDYFHIEAGNADYSNFVMGAAVGTDQFGAFCQFTNGGAGMTIGQCGFIAMKIVSTIAAYYEFLAEI